MTKGAKATTAGGCRQDRQEADPSSRDESSLQKRFCIQYGLRYATSKQIFGLPVETIALNNNIERIKPMAGTAYVLKDFEGPLYDIIKNNGAPNNWILGPPALQRMVMDNQCRLRREPIYCNSMENLYFFVNLPGRLKNRAAHLIMWMGGRFVSEPNLVTTHMVTTSTLARGYSYCQTFNVPVMTVEWLELCWELRDVADFNPTSCQSQFEIRPFTGLYVHVCEKGFAPSLVNEVVTMIYDCDAELVALNDTRCTHMIVSHSASKDTSLAIAPSAVYIVNEDWVRDSFSANEKVDESFFECTDLSTSSMELQIQSPITPIQEPEVEEVPCEESHIETIEIDSDSDDSADTVNDFQLHADGSRTSKTSRTAVRRSRSTCSQNKSTELIEEERKQLQSRKENNILKRKHTLQELLSTERNFIKCIRALVVLKDATDKIMNKAESKMIFGNVDKLQSLHERIMNELDLKLQAEPEGATIADIFIYNREALQEVYVLYSKQVSECQNLFAKKYKEDDTFRNASDVLITAQFSGKPKDLFIRPVQRLCSVCLLLKEIQKYTPDDHPDKKMLSEAVILVNNVLKQMDDGRKETDKINRLFEVYGWISGFPAYLLSSHRQYISKFNVEEFNPKKKSNGPKFVLFLFNDIILVAKANTKKEKPYKYLENISLTFVLYLVRFSQKHQGKEIFGIMMQNEEGGNKTKPKLYLYPEQEHDLEDFLLTIADHLSQRDSSKSAQHFIRDEHVDGLKNCMYSVTPKRHQAGVIHKAKRKLMSGQSTLRRSTSCSELKHLSTAL